MVMKEARDGMKKEKRGNKTRKLGMGKDWEGGDVEEQEAMMMRMNVDREWMNQWTKGK